MMPVMVSVDIHYRQPLLADSLKLNSGDGDSVVDENDLLSRDLFAPVI